MHPDDVDSPKPHQASVGSVVVRLTGWPDRAIGQIAAGQKALVTRKQLLGLGLDRGPIQNALARGRLHRLHRGVYSLVPPAALPALARQLAAVLACGDSALLSHHSAAAVWGIRPFLDGDIEVTVIASDAGRARAGINAHRTTQLQRHDARRFQEIPITSPARTLLDIAPQISGRSLEWAVDQALVKRLTSLTQIRAALVAYPHRPASDRLRALADSDRPTTVTRSHPEERALAILRKAGFPTPEVNAKIGNYTADFLWRAERVILEIDGYHYHHTRAAFERDRQRDTAHQIQDFLVIRATPRQLEHNHDALLVHIATLLERRRAA